MDEIYRTGKNSKACYPEDPNTRGHDFLRGDDIGGGQYRTRVGTVRRTVPLFARGKRHLRTDYLRRSECFSPRVREVRDGPAGHPYRIDSFARPPLVLFLKLSAASLGTPPFPETPFQLQAIRCGSGIAPRKVLVPRGIAASAQAVRELVLVTCAAAHGVMLSWENGVFTARAAPKDAALNFGSQVAEKHWSTSPSIAFRRSIASSWSFRGAIATPTPL